MFVRYPNCEENVLHSESIKIMHEQRGSSRTSSPDVGAEDYVVYVTGVSASAVLSKKCTDSLLEIASSYALMEGTEGLRTPCGALRANPQGRSIYEI